MRPTASVIASCRAGLDAVLLQPVGVALDVAKFQRVGRRLRHRQLFEFAVVEQRGEARLGGDRHVVAGARHHHEIGLEILVEDELAALRALDPQVFRRVAPQERADLRRDDVGNPVHRPSLDSGAALTTPRTPAAIVSTSPATAATVSGPALPSTSEARTASTSAEPTTTPSALAAMPAALAASLTPNPTATGRWVCRLMRATASPTFDASGAAEPGNAGDRHVIDEARGVGEHGGKALVVGGRRRQADEIEPGLQRRQAQLLVFLRRQIDDDQPVDSGRVGVAQEALRRRRRRSGCNSPSARPAYPRPRREIRAPAPASCARSARHEARAGPRPESPARRPSDR